MLMVERSTCPCLHKKNIRDNPNIGNSKTGDLKGIYSLDIHYNRTNYELAYRVSQLEKSDMVVIYFTSYPSVRYLNNLHM